MANEKRIDWIDMAKGMGMILVVYGHVSFTPEWLDVWLCSFHMPLFFFLSGLTFNVDKYSEFKLLIKNKIKTLVIPYLIFACVTWFWRLGWELIYFIKGGTAFDIGYLIKQAIGIAVQIRTTSYGIGVWFIPCIFVVFVILYVIMRISKEKRRNAMILATSCLVVGYFYCEYVDIKLPWAIDAALVAVFFMTIGCVFQTGWKKALNSNKKYIVCVIAFAVNIMCTYLNWRILGRTVGMWSNNYGNLIYFLGGAISGIVFAMCISNIFSIESIRSVGKNSIFYYGTHILVVEVLSIFVTRIPGIQNEVVGFIVTTGMVIIILMLLRLFLPIYKKIYDVSVKRCFSK